MPKINREEYEVLKGLDDKWKWMARDEDSELSAYRSSPNRSEDEQYWVAKKAWEEYNLNIDLFQFIQWEDSEPYIIAELIGEYESEETEVKDIEEVKDEVAEELEAWRNVEGGVDDEGIDTIMVIIDQLDEPEVLSKNWIDEHITDGHNVNLGDKVVYADELDGVPVPKQEEITEEQVAEHLRARNMTAVDSELVYREKLDNKIVIEKPTIPQFVAEWYEEYKSNLEGQLQGIAYNLDKYGEMPEVNGLDKWINETECPMQTLASLNFGYEVAEEQKYRVEDSHGRTLLAKMTYSDKGKRFDKVEPYNELIVGYKKELTEEEIKDYDPKYWAFRKPLEELEE